jgi:chromosome segregation ATPase
MKLLLSVVCATATTVTPTQKVIQLLQEMMAKGKAEKDAEEIKFSRFSQWCTNTEGTKSAAIAKGKATIENLGAEIEKLNADVKKITEEMSVLDEELATHKADIKAAASVRSQEKADYVATHNEYDEAIDADKRAIHDVEEKAHDEKQTSAFMQNDGINEQAPEANGYENHMGGLIDTLTKTGDDFRKERRDLEKAEMEQKFAFESLMQTLHQEIAAATKNRDRKAATKAKKEKRSAEAAGEKKEAESDLAADSQYLSDLQSECQVKHTDFEARQKLRGEELEAIGKAVDILSSDDVSGAADRNLPGLVQRGSSLLQLRRRSAEYSPAQAQVAVYLQEQSARLGSALLAQVAESADADPFKKVKKMIKDMVIKLKEEANEEAEHQGWCDTELTTNQQTRDHKTSQVEQAQASIAELQASNAKLTADIEELQAQVAELEAGMAKATEDRASDKAKNKAAVEDAKAAQVAVANALSVLEEFYSKAKGATSFVQGPHDDAPETFSEPYQGMQGESGGVVGMLEVIQSDFARLESDTQASEAEGKEEYEKFMSDSETDKAVKETDIKNKSDKITRQAEDLSQTEESMNDSQKELDAAMDYYDKLKPSCVGGGVNYDDRVKQREAEIQSLKEALSILKGDDIPMPIESGRAQYETGASHQG